MVLYKSHPPLYQSGVSGYIPVVSLERPPLRKQNLSVCDWFCAERLSTFLYPYTGLVCVTIVFFFLTSLVSVLFVGKKKKKKYAAARQFYMYKLVLGSIILKEHYRIYSSISRVFQQIVCAEKAPLALYSSLCVHVSCSQTASSVTPPRPVLVRDRRNTED